VSLTPQEEIELERLLLIQREWEKHAAPAVPILQPPAPAETNEKSAKPSESKPTVIEPDRRHYIDKICPEGSTKPSGKMLGKDGWML
jgi:hypothetical protein